MPRGEPKVAQVEDYDSDVSAVKAGTRKVAHRRSTTGGPPKSMDRYHRSSRPAGSDSGYSSQTTGTQESKASADAKAMPPPPRPSTTQPQSSAKSKPVLIQRTSSQRNSERAPSKSPTKAAAPRKCSDPNCHDPNCGQAVQEPSRRDSAQQYPVQYAAQYGTSPGGYQQNPYQYQYQQMPPSNALQQVPTLTQPRPRTGSSSQQARPASFHAYSYSSYPNGNQGGPPPSASAYQNQMLAWQNYQMQQHPYQAGAPYGSTPPNQSFGGYMQASPIASSPITTQMNATSGLQRTISARAVDGNTAGGVVARSQPQAISSARSHPVRQQSARVSIMPGAFPTYDSTSSESPSESDSSSEYSEPEQTRVRPRLRDSRQMSTSSSRRPSIKGRYATEPVVPTRSSRDVLRRNPRSDYVLDDILSSDNVDSDKTTRAITGKPRTTYTGSSRSSRQQSVSTNASSGRTKTTAPSSVTGGSQIIVEDSKGRRVSYMSKRDRDDLIRQLQATKIDDQRHDQRQEQRRREEEIEAYQDKVRGAKQAELTADNIRKQQHRTSNSHASGHTRQTSRSSSSKAGGGDGFKIDYGGTVLHVYGDTKVELQAGEDGAPGRITIGGGPSGKDSAYHGSSKSSSSRVGRSRGGSVRGDRRRERSIREEDGYEPAL